MTEEQKKVRKLSAESGKIRWIKDHCLRTKDDNNDYVFISYKSDDFEKVLDDIVYNACKKYGLRVYFDTAFDENSDSWIMQYHDNMCDPKCKAFVAFIDDAYYSSYACLLEMMSCRTAAAGGDYKKDTLFFLPINIGTISDIVKSENTGLGTRRFSNGKINSHAKEELERFNEIFSEVADDIKEMRRNIYKRENQFELYDEKTSTSPQHGKMYLSVTQCRRLMEMVIPSKNDNDGGNKSFADVIHDKLWNAEIRSVFGPVEEEETSAVKPLDDKKQEELPAPQGGKTSGLVTPVEPCSGTISLKDFVKKFNNNNFKKDTFTKFRLVGKGQYDKYTTDYHDSAFNLAWAFVMQLLSERGIDYINNVTRMHPDLKNPVFITLDVYKTRNDQNKYRQIEVKGLENYYMYRHYGQYQWVDSVLRPRLTEYGLPVDEFVFEYVTGSDILPELEAEKMSAAEIGRTEETVVTVQTVTTGGITGPVTLSGGESVQKLEGQFTLEDFLKKYSNKTFQSKSCKYIRLLGINGHEKYSVEVDENGNKIQTARQLVFNFAMRRLDDMGMAYVNLVNAHNTSKNPIFITEEEHNARKARKESVTYTKVISKSVNGYSMCTHYAEYDWFKNSFMKQITALGLSKDDFVIIFEQ